MATLPPRRTPSRAVRVVAAMGGASLVPYIAIKSYWALGGTAGMPSGFDMTREFEKNGAPALLVWMERHGIDFTAILALLGVALLSALIHPRAVALPRGLLLVPAWLGAMFFIPYGLLTAAVKLISGDIDGAPDFTPWLTVAGVAAFCGVGASLAVCARSFQIRTSRIRASR